MKRPNRKLIASECRRTAATISIWSYLKRRGALLLSVEAGSESGIASAFTPWPVLGMMKTDRIRGAWIAVGEFPGAILSQSVI